MLHKCTFFDSEHEYVARLENGVYIIGYSTGIALGTDGHKYRHICQYDEDENMISEGWQQME